MNALSAGEIEIRFRKSGNYLKEPSLYFRCKVFGPEGPTYKARKNLRELLVKELEKAQSSIKNPLVFSQKQRTALLTPGTRPQNPVTSISVSHCPVAGGFVFSFNKKISLGLDMEQSHRVSLPVISRISTREEIRQAPARSLLWTAKEAVFKCVTSEKTDHKNLLLKDMLISKWKQKDPENRLFQFQVKNSGIKGQGVAFFMNNLAFSCSILKKPEGKD